MVFEFIYLLLYVAEPFDFVPFSHIELHVAYHVTRYFTRKGEVLISPFWGSVWRTIRYHLGSVAMGSLIIALVKVCVLPQSPKGSVWYNVEIPLVCSFA